MFNYAKPVGGRPCFIFCSVAQSCKGLLMCTLKAGFFFQAEDGIRDER